MFGRGQNTSPPRLPNSISFDPIVTKTFFRDLARRPMLKLWLRFRVTWWLGVIEAMICICPHWLQCHGLSLLVHTRTEARNVDMLRGWYHMQVGFTFRASPKL